MADSITKRDLEDILDKKLEQYQKTIVEAVDFKFSTLETHIDQRLQKVESEISDLRSEIRRLTITLDNFVKMMTDYKEEFTILKGEVDKIKSFIKEKFGVEIAIQG